MSDAESVVHLPSPSVGVDATTAAMATISRFRMPRNTYGSSTKRFGRRLKTLKVRLLNGRRVPLHVTYRSEKPPLQVPQNLTLNVSKEMVGRWRDKDGISEFRSNGTFHSDEGRGRRASGRWSIKGDIIAMIADRVYQNRRWQTLKEPVRINAKILSFAKDKFVARSSLDNKIYTYTRVSSSEPTTETIIPLPPPRPR